MHGRPYEALMRSHYPYAAVLEFDDLAGLKAYLEHPAHERLGSLFFEAFEDALMYDFDMQEGAAGLAAALRPALGAYVHVAEHEIDHTPCRVLWPKGSA